MGYLRISPHVPETDELHLPSDPQWIVHMKRKATYGDSRAAQSALMRITEGKNGNAGQMVTDMEIGAFVGTLTARMIVSWNLTDENDQPLPVTPDSLDLLSDEDGEFLSLEAQKRKGVRLPEEQAPFPTPSDRPSVASRSRTQK